MSSMTAEELANAYIQLGLAVHPDMAALIEELRLASGNRLMEIIVEINKEMLKGKPREQDHDDIFKDYVRY